jgi:hypothetical protein
VRRGRIIQAHAQRNAFSLNIDRHHFYCPDGAGLHHVTRNLDEAVGERGNLHQAILMNAHIDECAEVGHTLDRYVPERFR